MNKKQIKNSTFLLVLAFLIAFPAMAQDVIYGNRIPKDYFITWGKGESDVTIHAGSYDDALRMAGIEDYNLMKYSSVLPPESVEVPLPKETRHGAVLETIMAEQSGKKGERLTAGLIISKAIRKADGKYLGGFVAEYSGFDDKETSTKILQNAMKGIFERRYEPGTVEMGDTRVLVESFIPRKKYGSIMVVIGFTSYIFPQIKQ